MSPRLTHTLVRAGIAAALFLLPIAVVTAARADAPEGHLAAAARLIQAGDTAQGARLLAARVKLDPADLAAQAYLTIALDRLAQATDAAGLEGVRQVLPAWPPVLERLALVYDGKGRAAEAEAVYKSWIALRPGNPEPYARLAEHEAGAGHYAKAIALFERHRVLVGESDYAARRIAAVRDLMQGKPGPAWPPAPEAGATVARAR